MEDADDTQLALAVGRVVEAGGFGGRSSAQVLSALQLPRESSGGRRVLSLLSRMSVKPSSRKPSGNVDKPLVRLCRRADGVVVYVLGSFFYESQHAACTLCGGRRGDWQLLGGDYCGASIVPLFRSAIQIVLCESCFRTRFIGGNPVAETVGFAVLPHDFFAERRARAVSAHSARSNATQQDCARQLQDDEPATPDSDGEGGAGGGGGGGSSSGGGSRGGDSNFLEQHDDDETPLLLGRTRERVLQETVHEVRNFGVRGGTWHDIIEKVRTAILPRCVENLKDVVQWSLHVSSSKTLKSSKPLLRRAMVGFDGCVQVLFISKEFIDPNHNARTNHELACGIRLEIADQAVPGAMFGLRPYTTFRVLIEDRDAQVEHDDGGPRRSTSPLVSLRSPASLASVDSQDTSEDQARSQSPATPTFEILRRYSDFVWLRDELVHWHGDEAMVPPLPRKRFVGRFNESFLEARMHALEHFLSIVATHPVLHHADALQAFFKRAPLEQIKPEYDSKAPERVIRRRDRRSSSGRSPRLGSMQSSEEGSPLDGSKGSASSRALVGQPDLGALQLERGQLHRDVGTRRILSGDFQRALRKAYKRIDTVAECHLRSAVLYEERARHLKFLASVEIPEIERFEASEATPLTHVSGTGHGLSDVPLGEASVPTAYCALAAVELLSSLSRLDVLAGTASRATCIRNSGIKMQLKEWHRSLQEFTCWFENRAHSIRFLERSMRAKRSLILEGGRALEDEEDSVKKAQEASASKSAPPLQELPRKTRELLAHMEGVVERTREDARLESEWLEARNSQELVAIMTTFVELQMEHARQMSRMWQDFLPQLLVSLEQKYPVGSPRTPDVAEMRWASTNPSALPAAGRQASAGCQNGTDQLPSIGSTFRLDGGGTLLCAAQDNPLWRDKENQSANSLSELDIDDDEDDEDDDEDKRSSSGGRGGKGRAAWDIDPSDIAFGECIGSGSFGEVYEGVFHGQRVAVKKFHVPVQTEQSLANFRREAAVMRQLPAHANLISFFGTCSRPGNVCLVMELVESGSMLQLLLRDGGGGGGGGRAGQRARARDTAGDKGLGPNGTPNVTVRRKRKAGRAAHAAGGAGVGGAIGTGDISELDAHWQLKLALGAARGIHVLHSCKPQILHRDIKTSNLLVALPSLTVKVCDFGLSRFKLESQSVKSFVGTASWVAPEVIMSRQDGYSAKADVYSFGIVLWQIYARAQPHPNMHATQVLFQVAREGLRPEVPRCAPAALAALMERCWHHDAAARPAFDEIVVALEDALGKALEESATYG